MNNEWSKFVSFQGNQNEVFINLNNVDCITVSNDGHTIKFQHGELIRVMNFNSKDAANTAKEKLKNCINNTVLSD